MSKKPVTALVMHPVVRDEMLTPTHISRLDEACTLLQPVPCADFDALPGAGADAEILMTSWGCPTLDDERLATMPRLRLIAHLGGSVKGFIGETAWRRRISVINCVAANAVPVAEYTLAAILFSGKRVFDLSRHYAAHKENRAPWTREAPNGGNYGKTVGIVGASHVGRAVMELLKHHDFEVLLYDPHVSPLQARHLGTDKVSLTDLLARSDVVSLHPPLLPETHHMIGARELMLMRDDATLINTARGAIVDADALLAELRSGRLHAVLDTTEPDVPPPDSPLYTLPNVFLTPHIAGSMGNETFRLADDLIKNVCDYVDGRVLKNTVKLDELSRSA